MTKPASGSRAVFHRMIRFDGFGQPEVEEDRVCKAQRGRKHKRHVNAPTAQDTADCWSKDEPDAKRGADQSHAAGAVLFRRDVGDVRLRGRDVSAGNAVENSSG